MLKLLATHISPVYISRSTFQNVNDLSENEARKNHIIIQTPALEILMLSAQTRGRLAYDDRETLLLAKKYGWVCITNDKPLRKECKKEKVSVLWGLEPLKLLVINHLIVPDKAISVAKNIQEENPRYITVEIVEKFKTQIRIIK